jgi:hypothetical protein
MLVLPQEHADAAAVPLTVLGPLLRMQQKQ